MEEREPITINLNFIFNTVVSTTDVKETIVEQVLNLDYEQLAILAGQQEKGGSNG